MILALIMCVPWEALLLPIAKDARINDTRINYVCSMGGFITTKAKDARINDARINNVCSMGGFITTKSKGRSYQ